MSQSDALMLAESGESDLERFSLYGMEVKIPKTWRVEFNPKGTRERADVVFQSPMKNRVYVSWGSLRDAGERFHSLDEQKDYGVSVLEKSRGVKSLSITGSTELQICGHRALETRLTMTGGGGFFGPRELEKRMDTIYFHCPESGRYYVIYSELHKLDEYADFHEVFNAVFESVVCHRVSSSPK